MLRKVVSAALVVVLQLVGLHGSGQQTLAVASRTPASTIAEASEALRERITQAMEQAAGSYGLELDTSDIVYLCRHDIVLACAGVAGFEDAARSASLAAVDVGLVYFSREVEVRFGDGAYGTRPPGLYAVRVALNPSRSTHDLGITLLELAGSAGSTGLTLPAELLEPTAQRIVTACLDVDAEEGRGTACLGWFGRGFSIRLCVVFGAAN